MRENEQDEKKQIVIETLKRETVRHEKNGEKHNKPKNHHSQQVRPSNQRSSGAATIITYEWVSNYPTLGRSSRIRIAAWSITCSLRLMFLWGISTDTGCALDADAIHKIYMMGRNVSLE